MNSDKENIGLIIDVENIKKTLNRNEIDYDINKLVEEIKREGIISIGKAYVSFGYENQDRKKSAISDGLSYVYYRNGLDLCLIPTINGKNLADPVIICDTVEMLYQYEKITMWVIATADKDFIPLLRKIIAHGKKAMVIGDSNSQRLIDECHRLNIKHKDICNIMPRCSYRSGQ